MLQFKQLNFSVLIIDIIKRNCFYKTVFTAFVCATGIFSACSSFAQTDTTIVDTISMAQIDSLTQPESADEYEDTTVKHIYDTSQYFFNWKDDFHQPYTKEKFAQRHLIDKTVNELKRDDDFWYVPAIEKIENRLKTDAAYRDSLLKAANKEIADENEKSFSQQRWFRFLMWFIIIGVFLTAVIYFLFQNKINLFSKEAASATRQYVRYGASPRGMQALILAGKIMALLDGRFNVAFADLKLAALPALRHRIILNFEAQAEGIAADDVIRQVVETVKTE